MNDIRAIHTHMIKLGFNVGPISKNRTNFICVMPSTTESYSFTFFWKPYKWYKVSNEKSKTIFYPANGIGENFEPNCIEEIQQKFLVV